MKKWAVLFALAVSTLFVVSTTLSNIGASRDTSMSEVSKLTENKDTINIENTSISSGEFVNTNCFVIIYGNVVGLAYDNPFPLVYTDFDYYAESGFCITLGTQGLKYCFGEKHCGGTHHNIFIAFIMTGKQHNTLIIGIAKLFHVQHGP